MSGFLIFLAAALWFGLRIRKAYLKQVSELESDTSSDTGTVKSAFEMLFEELHTNAAPHQSSKSFASEVDKSGHFSYESDAMEAQATSKAHRVSRSAAKSKPPVTVPTDVEELSEMSDFDLRQAVIYETILNNKYLSDVQS